MGFFKKAEEKQREKELEKRIAELDRFPGTLTEYNELKGVEYVMLDTGRPQKFVYVDNRQETQVLKWLIDKGCTGLIWYIPLFYTHGTVPNNGGYGIPVKRKETVC